MPFTMKRKVDQTNHRFRSDRADQFCFILQEQHHCHIDALTMNAGLHCSLAFHKAEKAKVERQRDAYCQFYIAGIPLQNQTRRLILRPQRLFPFFSSW